MRAAHLAIAATLLAGCSREPEKAPEPAKPPEKICEIRTKGDPSGDMYLFPTPEGAEEFDSAIRMRDAVRANLAVLSATKVPGGSKCQLMDINDRFALVHAVDADVSGWVWYHDVRRDPDEP